MHNQLSKLKSILELFEQEIFQEVAWTEITNNYIRQIRSNMKHFESLADNKGSQNAKKLSIRNYCWMASLIKDTKTGLITKTDCFQTNTSSCSWLLQKLDGYGMKVSIENWTH